MLKFMMEYKEDDFLNLAGIQHFVFCRRQWALIHIEQQWSENVRTAEGRIFHQNAHEGLEREVRGNTILVRGMPVFSRALGVNGVCDVVEFQKSEDGVNIYGTQGKWIPIPIEYKKGKPKEDDSDTLQLAAQAICLEEMLICKIRKGYLFYGETRHRSEVVFDTVMRKKVYEVTEEMHSYYNRMYTPKVKISKKCKACSLNELCLPILCKNTSARNYILDRLKEEKEFP